METLIRALPIWKHAVQISPLTGGITNRNWLVTDGEQRYAARCGVDDARLGISRRNELACARAAAELGVAPGIVHAAPGVLVTRFVAGQALTPELAREPERIGRVAAALRAIHGTRVEGHLRWFCPFQVARTYLALAREEGLTMPVAADALRADLARLQARVLPFVPAFCHNDLMPGNLLDEGGRVWVIDWEYAGIGHPLFDLGGLASNCDFGPAEEQALLVAYGAPGAILPQLRIYRAMAALREALWAVVQGARSSLDFDYAGYREESLRRYAAALARV